MPCFFCSSLHHLSHNCDIYVSFDVRKVRAQCKKCCWNCLSNAHVQPSLEACRVNLKCFICFSREHHSVYCCDRKIVANYFVPRIDYLTLTRLTKMMDKIEHIHMAASSPNASNLIHVIPVSVHDMIWCNTYQGKIQPLGFLPEPNTHCATNTLEFMKLFSPPDDVRRWFTSLNVFGNGIFATCVFLDTCEFCASEFLMFLSSSVKEFRCRNVHIGSHIFLSNIMERIPNVLNLKLYATDVIFDLDRFEQYLKGKSKLYLKQLKVDTDEFLFDGVINCNMILKKFRN